MESISQQKGRIRMKSLDSGEDKIQQICDAIRKETLEPVLQESKNILENAKKNGEKIIADAKKQAESILAQARQQVEQERNVFQSSLAQSVKQSLESLRQNIESKLFNDQVQTVLEKESANPKVVADLINAIVKSIEKSGIDSDLSAVIPKNVPAAEVNKLLLSEVVNRLKDKGVEVGNFNGGAQVKVVGKRMTIDISDNALKELLSSYARKDFRNLIFNS